MNAKLAPSTGAHPVGSPTRERLVLPILLLCTAVLYLADITVNGMANTFYSGATWAGTRSWKALLFGSVDPGNFITVDKPPVSQWVMGLSGRIFGFSAASLLVPEAIMGVLAVWLTYATVRRVSTTTAALMAGAALAVTPVAALMFRFDNPDAVMVLLMVAACWCTVRAAQHGGRWWLCLGGVAFGFAFLAKMLEGVMSLPALLLLYVMAAPITWRRKVSDIVMAAVAFVVSAGWYVVLTMLWPASSRPYLAGSTDNSFLDLAFGYNGLSRVQGRSGRGVRTGGFSRGDAGGFTPDAGSWNGSAMRSRSGMGGAMGGKTGITRLFSGEFGLEISWLIPAAFVALAGVIVLRRGRGRRDLVRATALSAGTWMLLSGLVLSFMGGTTHAYYTLAIAAPIAMLVGLGIGEGWAARDRLAGRVVVALTVLSAVAWSAILWFDQASSWMTPLLVVVIVLGLVSAGVTLVMARRGRASVAAFAVAMVSVIAAPAAFAINVDTSAHTGSSPSVNPVASSAGRGGRGAPASPGGSGMWGSRTGDASGAGGGFGRGSLTPDPALDVLLRSSHARWAAATATTSAAAQLELNSRASVMGIGGFTGSDPTPTLAAFEHDVAKHEVGYYVVSATAGADSSRAGRGDGAGRGSIDGGSTGSGSGGGWGGDAYGGSDRSPGGGGTRGGMPGRAGTRGGTSSAISAWVASHFTEKQVGHATVYDLSRPK